MGLVVLNGKSRHYKYNRRRVTINKCIAACIIKMERGGVCGNLVFIYTESLSGAAARTGKVNKK